MSTDFTDFSFLKAADGRGRNADFLDRIYKINKIGVSEKGRDFEPQQFAEISFCKIL